MKALMNNQIAVLGHKFGQSVTMVSGHLSYYISAHTEDEQILVRVNSIAN